MIGMTITMTIAPAGAADKITCASTTSTQNSGLFEVLLPAFKKATGIDVAVVAVGTGQALEIGRRGDADVLFVHDPEKEEKFVAEGYGIARKPVMYNDFIIVGPAADPAKIKGMKDATEAFKKMAASGFHFVSRGDKSGTNSNGAKSSGKKPASTRRANLLTWRPARAWKIPCVWPAKSNFIPSPTGAPGWQ